VLSLIITVTVDDLHTGLRSRELVGFCFAGWAVGSLLSAPLPVYLLLRPMTARRRWLWGSVIAGFALALWYGVNIITSVR
jgi:hypothetical protein